MDDLREHIRHEEGGLENLMRKIPGFAGYKDREERRQADQIQRNFLADSLTRERGKLDDTGNALLSHGGLQHIEHLDQLRTRLDKVIDRVRHAVQGCGGFFDAIRINEAELDRVYEYDLSLLHGLGSFTEANAALAAAADVDGTPDFAARLKDVERLVTALDQKLDDRTKTMQGVS
jgi:hypothetical protein